MDTAFVPRIVLIDAERRAETARDALQMHEVMDRKKDEMLHLLIHDLATPLQSITLRSEASSRTASGIIEDQKKIGRACREVSKLLQDAVDVGTLETGELQPRCDCIALRRVLAEVTAECQALAEDRGITLVQSCEGDVSAAADPRLLKRVVTNLVVNAIHHSGTDRVRLEVVTRETWVVVRVIDYGRGIARSDAGDIFDKFRRGPDSRGMGLGLYFCKLAVDAMEGRVSVESEPGLTVFEVALRPVV
jgi:signal transduction histidine kinase